MTSRHRIYPGHLVGVAFLAIQLLSIVYARFVDERFFCWAPYDEHSRYAIGVTMGGRSLSEAEVASRYRYQAAGWEPRSIHNIISLVEQYEMTYGGADDVFAAWGEVIRTREENMERHRRHCPIQQELSRREFFGRNRG